MKKPVSDTLREVKLRLMEAKACNHFMFYNHNLQICVGNPRKKRSAYKVPQTYTSSSHLVSGRQVPAERGWVRKSAGSVTVSAFMGF